MSFDDYVHHISQKYRLAVAISVIKTKPSNVSVEEYLLQLQNKIKDLEFDPNETVCSDDFNFDDDDISHERNQQNTCTEISKNNYSVNETRLDYSVNDNDSQCSQTILNDFVFDECRLAPAVERESTIGDTIRLLKEVSAIHEKSDANQNLSQLTFCESQEAITANNDVPYCDTNNSHIQNDIENNYLMDSQETELYTLHGFTQSYSHVSQTQGDYFVLSNKYVRSAAVIGNIQDANNINGQIEDKQILNTSRNLFTQNDYDAIASERDAIGDVDDIVQDQINDVDGAGFSNAQSFQYLGQNVTTICANGNITDSDKGNKTAETETHEVISNVENVNFDDTQTFQFNYRNAFVREDIKRNILTTSAKDNKDKNEGTENNMKDLNNIDIRNSTKTELHNENAFANVNTETTNDIQKDNNINCKDNEDFTNKTPEHIPKEQFSKEVNIVKGNDQEMDVDETESDDNVQEIVPFKVLEELNRVKAYLNRKDRDRRYNDGYSTDSGYRSDSQSRCSLKSASQVCGAWLNQSAYCLFSYLVQTAGTDDIDKEIAQVLGQLIDKLHEDENYPQFLEEMLETIDGLLDDVLEGVCAENELITKDENIQRLMLLNKSKHILKHSIEKITNMVEKLHTNLTQENLYELTDINEIENASYIFHILEIFLKRYVKIKDSSSQNTQNSQEDIFPKRSSLTELWRKKWNPHCKEIIKQDNKKCILKRCREILNKIIVECMDGYSLVAFAALQCFNSIQI